QALQLASQLLFSQGITNPTPEQIRVALMGGTVASGFGTNVQLQGVLQSRGSSPASPTFTTTNPTFTTTNPAFSSATPGFPAPTGAFPGTATGASVGSSAPNGPPSPAAQ